jgi:hypothetical protein
MYYETMERVLRQTDKTVVETTGVTPYLPLPELRRAAAQTRRETRDGSRVGQSQGLDHRGVALIALALSTIIVVPRPSRR